MNHDIRARSADGEGEGGGVEDIDDHRLDASGTQHVCFNYRAGRADDMVPGVEQQRHQALANGARGSCQENLHATPRDRAGLINQLRPLCASSATDGKIDATASAATPKPRPIRQTSVHPPSTHAVPANAEPPAPPIKKRPV